jgi:crotonobetainyl-CoA:carnitine CoA-transferase CaiB-like acyl-CoA transferase
MRPRRPTGGGWLAIVGLAIVAALLFMEWTNDPRYQTLSGRAADCPNVTTKLRVIFATKTLAEWREVYDREGIWWAPVATMDEIVGDLQAEACGAF